LSLANKELAGQSEVVRETANLLALKNEELLKSEEHYRSMIESSLYPIVIVGDQPSKSPWNESHPHRRIYYDTLKKVGAANVHLTDLYKRRGESSSLKHLIPDDFEQHLDFFRREIAILKPTRIVALGQLAYNLLQVNFPELKDLGQMWHFAYVSRSGKSHLYESHMKRAIWRTQID